MSIEDFGHENEAWLRKFLELPNGIPSHDTLSKVMGRIERHAFAEALGAWMAEALPSLAGRHVAIDGKSLRGSGDGGRGAVHLLSAFASEARLVLGARAVEDKSNEITAIPVLLKQLELAGEVVTIDAMGCQKSIAGAIVAQKADYVLALKDNHPELHEDVVAWLEDCDVQGHVRQVEPVEKDHGRLETRRVVVSTDLDWLPVRAQWADLQAVAMVEATREKRTGQSSRERRYYLCSITDPQRIAQSIRAHWHWLPVRAR